MRFFWFCYSHFTDLNNFSIRLEPLSGRKFDDPDAVAEYGTHDPERQSTSLLNSRCHVDLYLEVRYLLHSVGGAAAVAPTAAAIAANSSAQGL